MYLLIRDTFIEFQRYVTGSRQAVSKRTVWGWNWIWSFRSGEYRTNSQSLIDILLKRKQIRTARRGRELNDIQMAKNCLVSTDEF